LVQKLQTLEFPFHKFFEEEQTGSPKTEEIGDNCYLILEYETNRAKIMRKNYQMTWNLGQIIGTRFYVEETLKGFIIFFDRAVDYDIAQVDRENPQELLNWIKNSPLGKDKKWMDKIQMLLFGK